MNFSPGKLGDCFEHTGIQGMFFGSPWIGCSSQMSLDFQGGLSQILWKLCVILPLEFASPVRIKNGIANLADKGKIRRFLDFDDMMGLSTLWLLRGQEILKTSYACIKALIVYSSKLPVASSLS